MNSNNTQNFKIFLESKDKHGLEFTTKAKSLDDAKIKLYQYISENDYSGYLYQIKKVEIKDIEN